MNCENLMTSVDLLKALLTPAIAVLTALIAVAQYRLAKAKFRHELYERRSAVYKAAMKFIAQVKSAPTVKLDEAHTSYEILLRSAFSSKEGEYLTSSRNFTRKQ
jgi:hypothetical protein